MYSDKAVTHFGLPLELAVLTAHTFKFRLGEQIGPLEYRILVGRAEIDRVEEDILDLAAGVAALCHMGSDGRDGLQDLCSGQGVKGVTLGAGGGRWDGHGGSESVER